jgi:hypothetical protein
MQPPYNKDNKTRLPLEHYLKRFAEADPREISRRTGIPYDGAFVLNVMGEKKTVTWPEFKDEGWSGTAKILFLRYLLEGAEAPLYREFSTYRELPWGEVYDANFQGRCVKKLARLFGGKPEDFERACRARGGSPVQSSGIGYEIPFMPGLYLRLFLWAGDEEFSAPRPRYCFPTIFLRSFPLKTGVVLCEYADR